MNISIFKSISRKCMRVKQIERSTNRWMDNECPSNSFVIHQRWMFQSKKANNLVLLICTAIIINSMFVSDFNHENRESFIHTILPEGLFISGVLIDCNQSDACKLNHWWNHCGLARLDLVFVWGWCGMVCMCVCVTWYDTVWHGWREECVFLDITFAPFVRRCSTAKRNTPYCHW